MPDDAYTLVLASWAFQDTVGFALDGEPLVWPIGPNESGDGYEGGDFSVNFAIDADSQALSTPLNPVQPLGSLIYQTPSDLDGTIAFAADTDEFEINLDAGQTVSVLVGQQTYGFQANIGVLDPEGTLISSATGGFGDSTLLVQTVPADKEGTYTVWISGLDGSLGLYTVGLVVNSALEEEAYGGPSNDVPNSAQSIEASFIPLVNGSDRGAVRGMAGDEDVYAFELAEGQSLTAAVKFDTAADSPFLRTDYYMNGASYVSLGDVNNDDVLDMVTPSYYGYYLELRLGNGDGTFGDASAFGYGAAGPFEVQLADVNGDGNLDAILANSDGAYSSGSVTVMLGRGDGTFFEPVGYFAGYQNANVVVGNVIGDESPDIVTVGYDDSFSAYYAFVLPNNGDGTFGTPVTYLAGSNPWDVTLGDVDGANGLDILVADFDGGYYTGQSVIVLMNQGDGTFVATGYFAGYSTSSVAVADVNGDTLPDIVTTSQNDSVTSVLVNDGSGGFGAPASFSVGAYYPYFVTLGDINNDGAADIVTGCYYNESSSAGAVSVLLNDGVGNFGSAQTIDAGYGIYCVALGDMNTDGYLDSAAAAYGSSVVSVLLNALTPTQLTLYAPDGSAVISSTAGTQEFDLLLTDFVASQTGTYGLGVSSVPRGYSLVVTRDAELSLEANDDLLSAQQLAHTGATDGQTILGTTLQLHNIRHMHLKSHWIRSSNRVLCVCR